MKAIRNLYSKLGVKEYYQRHGADYVNPHFEHIRSLLLQNQARLDYSQVLDFCCGSGEVSQVLETLGHSNTVASDPFTYEAYHRQFGKSCLRLDFKAVIRGQLTGNYSCIICSFAMHLCPPEQLYPLVQQLLQHSKTLVILTPHKRPVLEKLDGVVLQFEDFCLTLRGKKVRLKAYGLAP